MGDGDRRPVCELVNDNGGVYIEVMGTGSKQRVMLATF